MMMKNLILITLTSVLLVACSQKSVVPQDSLVEKQGIWYELDSQEPFTGVAEIYYGNGQLKNQIDMKAGLYDGLFEFYYPNGQLAQKINMKANLRDVLSEEYYEDGGVKEKANYKADVLTETLESDKRVGSTLGNIVKYFFIAVLGYIGLLLLALVIDERLFMWLFMTPAMFIGKILIKLGMTF